MRERGRHVATPRPPLGRDEERLDVARRLVQQVGDPHARTVEITEAQREPADGTDRLEPDEGVVVGKRLGVLGTVESEPALDLPRQVLLARWQGGGAVAARLARLEILPQGVVRLGPPMIALGREALVQQLDGAAVLAVDEGGGPLGDQGLVRPSGPAHQHEAIGQRRVTCPGRAIRRAREVSCLRLGELVHRPERLGVFSTLDPRGRERA